MLSLLCGINILLGNGACPGSENGSFSSWVTFPTQILEVGVPQQRQLDLMTIYRIT